MVSVLEASIEEIEIKDWYNEQCKEADSRREWVKDYMKLDRPVGMVFQTSEYEKWHQPILFEQFFSDEGDDSEDDTPTPGVNEELESESFRYVTS